jgi:predicted RNase H-like HicB family nuclease
MSDSIPQIPIIITRDSSSFGNQFLAYVVTNPDLRAFGKTEEDAVSELKIVLLTHIPSGFVRMTNITLEGLVTEETSKPLMSDPLSIPVIIVKLKPGTPAFDLTDSFLWRAYTAYDINNYQIGRTREEALERLEEQLYGRLPKNRESIEFTRINLNEF